MIVRLIIMTLIALAVNGQQARASDAASKAQKKDKASGGSGHGEAKTEDAHAAAAPQMSQVYVHRWLSFPALQGKLLSSDTPFQYKQQKGRVIVTIFLASWCLPCQELVKPLQKLEEKFSGRYTDFVYIFAHDTEADARGFAKEYKLSERSILGSAPLLEAFHQPELPSIYVGDRYGWLVMRKLNTQLSELAELGKFLDLQTAF